MSPAAVDETSVESDPVDHRWMDRAVAAGASVQGRTAPNPWVGAVVVPPGTQDAADGDEGSTWFRRRHEPGGPHAEVVALKAAGARARSATLYVTLEPCAHHGRTPPCTEAIIDAGISRVVVGIEDPDPLVSGAGIAALRSAGVDVVVGVGATVVADQLAPYVKHRTTGRPWVVLSLSDPRRSDRRSRWHQPVVDR